MTEGWAIVHETDHRGTHWRDFDSRGHAFPTCEDHMVNLYGFRFIHLSDLMGEPQ